MTSIARALVGGSLAFGASFPARAEVLPPAVAIRTTAAAVYAAAGRSQPAGGASQGVIMAVEGKVRYRTGPDAAWQSAKVGAVIPEGGEVETAIRSAVQIKIGAGQILTIDRASRVGIKEAISRSGVEKTTVDLPYGRVKFEVSSTTVANDVKIQAPDATLAVKGTTGYMEVTPGQPTLSYGAENNTGVIAVTYRDTGTTSTIVQQQQTDAQAPDPAARSLDQTRVDVGAPAARQGDERQQVNNAPGGGQSLGQITGGGGPRQIRNAPGGAAVGPSDFAYIVFDGSTATLQREGVADGTTSEVRSGTDFTNSFDPAASAAGLAIGQTSGGRVFFRLEIGPSASAWSLLGLDLGTADSVFTPRGASSTGSEAIAGLGAIGGRLFTGGRPSVSSTDFESSIYEITPGSPTLNRRMVLPLRLGGELAGVNERGSVWVYGTPVGVAAPFVAGSFFEVDPRSNAVLRTAPPLITGPTTVYGSGVSPGVTLTGPLQGLAFAGDRLIAQVGPYFVVIDPAAMGTATSPSIVAIALSSTALPGLASESANPPPGPLVLAAQAGLIDPALNPIFAQMGYTAVAATSPVFRDLVFGELARTAASPSACATSGISGQLGAPLTAHVNQVGGVGLAVTDFRNSLPINHPCLRTGQVGRLPPLLHLASDGNVYGRDLSDNETLVYSGLSFDTSAETGLAIATDPGTQSRLLYLLQDVPSGSLLSVLDINSTSPSFSPVRSYSASDPIFTGLGAIGTRVFAGGLDDQFTPESYQIYDITDAAHQARMALPFRDLGTEIAGSNERGSLFIIGDTTTAATPGLLPSLFEVDPRNRYVRDVDQFSFGPTTVAPQGLDLNILASHDFELTGSGFVSNRLVVSILDLTTGQRYFLQIDPAAAGTSASPTIVRVSESMRDVLGIASETVFAPPAPLVLSSPTSMIDLSIGFFGSTAYSPGAAGRLAFQRMVAGAIIDSSVNPPSCEVLLNPAQLGSFLSPHANQNSGVGQAVNDYRLSIAPSHPCQIPGGAGAGGFDNQVVYIQPDGSLRVLTFSGPSLMSDGPVSGSTLASPSSAIASGLAIDLGATTTTLYQLRSTFSTPNTQFQIDQVAYPPTGAPPTIVAGAGGPLTPLMTGLGVLNFGSGPQIYTATTFDPAFAQFTIYNINTSTSAQTRIATFPGFDFDPAFTGSTQRGSLLAVGSLDSTPSPTLSDRILIEFDPRNSFIRSVTPFVLGAGVTPPSGFNPSEITQILSVAAVNNILVYSVVGAGSQLAFMYVDPAAAGGPVITGFTTTTNFPISLASNQRPPSQGVVPAAAPAGPIDARVDSVFSAMGYVPDANVTATVTNMIRRHIEDRSLDTASCVLTTEYGNLIPLTTIAAGQQSGVGQTLNRFYNGIDFAHPCQFTPDFLRFAEVDEAAGQLVFRDIEGVVQGIFNQGASIAAIDSSGSVGTPTGGGLTLRFLNNSDQQFLRMETRDTGTGFSSTFRTAPLGGGIFAAAGTLNTGATRLSGLASIDGRVFAGTRSGAAPFSISELNFNGANVTLGGVVIDMPGLGVSAGDSSLALGAAPARGTIFTPNFSNGFSIIEIDPRSNFLVDAWSTGSGQLQVDPNTLNNAPGFSAFSTVTSVSGIAVNNGLVTVTGAFASTGATPFSFTIDPAGVNGTSRPTVPSTRSQPSSINRGPFGLAANLPAIGPLPANLSNPGGAIDLRGLSAQFADLAYTQRALDSGVVAAMARTAIINSATDSSTCAGSSELSSQLGPALQSRVNQRSGVGRAITDFRNALPGGHPCRPL